jgi:diguanylate cyclase (GGDEF)-like protein
MIVLARGPESEACASLRHQVALVLGLLVVTGIVGFVDYAGGPDLRIYPLYIPAIAYAAWKVGAGAGATIAMASVGAWFFSHRLAGEDFSPAAWAINSLANMAAFATIVALIASLRRSRTEEGRLARTDPLTGLANTRAFLELASIEIERHRRFPRPLSIAYIDLDNFKMVNDRFGHAAGDQVLSVVARVLGESTRAMDKTARLGGDEFAVLMPETDEQGGRVVLERVQAAVAREMALGGWPVSCSIGAVVFREPPRDVDDLIGRADAVMYQVKKTSKNAIRIECFPSEAAASTEGRPSPS